MTRRPRGTIDSNPTEIDNVGLCQLPNIQMWITAETPMMHSTSSGRVGARVREVIMRRGGGGGWQVRGGRAYIMGGRMVCVLLGLHNNGYRDMDLNVVSH